MGLKFSLRDANTIAWLTAPAGMQSKKEIDNSASARLVRELGRNEGAVGSVIISSDRNWAEQLVQVFRDFEQPTVASERTWLRRILGRARKILTSFSLFGVGIATSWEQHKELDSFLHYAALDSGPHGLFLIPDAPSEGGGLDLLEPFPAFTKLADVSVPFPAVLFWSSSGVSHIASLDSARSIYQRLAKSMGNIESIDRTLSELARSEVKTSSFLQISDLHFGAKDVSWKHAYLVQSLGRIANEFNSKQVVITGDLMNSPSKANLQAFRNFNDELARSLGVKPIIIPGNHDQKRLWGMWQRSYRELADIEWKDIVPKDDLKVLFICFDSSRYAPHARGKVTHEQRLQAATQLEAELNLRAELSAYLKVVLVHHHPFTFPEGDTGVWRLFAQAGFNREQLLRMEDAEQFVSWCALKGATLILHGHKHVPCHFKSSVNVDPATGRNEKLFIRSVGCGSSTGVKNWPLSVNLVKWNPVIRSWSVVFFVDRGDGSGFRQAEIIAVDENLQSQTTFG